MIDLIPVGFLNEECFLSLNTDDKKYRPCLKMSQRDLEDTLGLEFYAEIESQYDSNALSTDNRLLYDNYIKEFLAWQTYFNYLKFANVSSTPTGIRAFNDENSSLATDIQMYSLEKNTKKTADDAKFRMINFLKTARANDTSKYPLWTESCREYMSFAITSVSKKSDTLIQVNKSIIANE